MQWGSYMHFVHFEPLVHKESYFALYLFARYLYYEFWKYVKNVLFQILHNYSYQISLHTVSEREVSFPVASFRTNPSSMHDVVSGLWQRH